jgi:succinoglycan biosynthesis transport protein ExoP
MERNLAGRLEAVHETLEWVSQELATQQAGVEDGDRSLAEYRESQDALSLNASADVVTTRLASLNEQVSVARAARLQRESLYRQVEHLDPTSADSRNHPSVAGVATATGRLTTLESELVGLASRYGPLHREMVRVNTELESAQRAVVIETERAMEAVRSSYGSAVDDARRLQAEFEAQQRLAAGLSRKEVDYRLLERQSASNQRIYERLLQQQNELEVVANRPRQQRAVDGPRANAGRTVHAEPTTGLAHGYHARPDPIGRLRCGGGLLR